MAASARRPDGKPAPRQAAAGRRSAGTAVAPRARRVGALDGVGAAVGEFIVRNPLTLGSSTAFLVALSFVSANAIWGQTQSHADAFFHTRPLPSGWNREAAGTTGSIGPAVARPAPDPTLRKVQAQLGVLGLYQGAVDGLPGPGTRKAVSAFQASHGMKVSGEVDAALLARLGGQADMAKTVATDDRVAAAATAGATDPDRQRMAKIQAGLKAFGIGGMEVDGIIGARTRAGIREFQAMFGLPQTGEADDAMLAKMRETGLTD